MLEVIHHEVSVVGLVRRLARRRARFQIGSVRLGAGEVIAGEEDAVVAVVRRAGFHSVAAAEEEEAGAVVDETLHGGPLLDEVLVGGVVDVIEESGAAEGRAEVGGASVAHLELDDEDLSFVRFDEGFDIRPAGRVYSQEAIESRAKSLTKLCPRPAN